MLRESRVTLPYHRPRQRTLAEFLNRREHTVLPVKSLKTSPTKLGAVWKTLEKKVTEAEQFYKSDSGSDEEEQSNKQGDEQDKKQDDGRENELEKKGEAPAAMDSVIISEVADSVSDDPNKEVVAEVGKALLCEESSDEKFPRSITPSVCDLGEKVTDVPVEGIKDIDEAVFVSGEVSDVLSDSENAKLNEERGDHKEESDSKVNNVDSSHDTELACHTSSISNNICDIAVCENIQKSDGDHLHSQIEKPTLPTASNTDFSNLFLKTEIQKKDGALQVDDCGSETLTDRCEDGPSTGTEQLHMQVNAGCSKIKIPSPPPMEDSESISLRLDDDTVDETGPKQECGHVSTLQGSPTDAANPEPQTQDEADPPRVSTPVRMLMELEDANNRDSAEEAEAVLSGHHNTSPLPTAVLHPSVISPIRLKGDPDNVIDLDEDVRTNPRKEVGVRDLMQRFIRHHIPKKVVCEEKKVDIGIEIVEGGGERGPEKVKREVMSVTLGGGDPIKNASPGTERPGARLRSLREELQREIARKRDEEWAKRQREYSLDEEEGGEEGKCNLDDEEEEELTESSSSEEEEEEVEENDVDMSTKSRPRSEYVDDEAEESDEEEEEDLGAGDNEESLTEDKDIDQDEEDEALILENDSKNEEPVERREVSSDVKDSSGIDEVDGSKVDTPAASGKKSKFQRFKTFDLFDSEDDNDNVSDYNSASELLSPPVTPFAKDRNGSKGRLSLPSPALPLTALQRYTNSPVGGQSWDFTQKQLSDDDNDGDEESPKQTKDENDPLKGKSALINLVGQSQESVVAEDELLNLMSGAFLSRVEKMSDAEDDFSLALEDTQEVFDKLQTKKVKEEGMDDDKRSVLIGSDKQQRVTFTISAVDNGCLSEHCKVSYH
ncbi:otolith matrix protein OMM-64-like [Hetaerina americana]|uniref:otolith matrix protein OMM-64-like n=1 Tax=Hetaerina americana TaxID=62018 RepID=UPI003A7F602B